MISTSVLTHTIHLNSSWGRSKHYNIGPTQGTKKEQEHLKTAQQTWGYQTGPSPKPLENETPKKKRIEMNITAFLSCVFLEFWKNSGESSKNMTSRCSSNPPTPSDRDWSTPRTKHQDTNRAMSSMPYSARKNAINCTLGKLNSPSINVWLRFSSTHTSERKWALLWRWLCTCTRERRSLVQKKKKVLYCPTTGKIAHYHSKRDGKTQSGSL